MKEKKLYLAADSGGSKTAWLLLDENGSSLIDIKTDGLGAAAEGLLPVLQTVAKAHEALSAIGEPCSIYLSLGGPNVDEVSTALRTVFGENVSICVEREANGNAILEAAKFIGCSAAVMCGTGSVAVGDTKDGRKYAGGWGPVYGDGGSGGGMGRDALRLFLRSIDTNEEFGGLSSLFSECTDGLDLSTFRDRMELKSRALGMKRQKLASLAPKIYELAERGDTLALSLYSDAAQEIAELAFAVSEDSEEFCVLLCGGFFMGKPRLLEMCREAFAKKSRARLKYESELSPSVAAQMAVLKRGGIEITSKIFENLLKKGNTK